MGHSPQDCRESDTTEQLSRDARFHQGINKKKKRKML